MPNEVGSNATGTLKNLQKVIDTSSSLSDVEAALKSATPINNADLELAIMAPIHKNLEAANNRINLFVNSGFDDLVYHQEYDQKDQHDYEADALRFCLSAAAEQSQKSQNKVKIVDQYDENSCSCYEPNSIDLKRQELKALKEKELLSLRANMKDKKDSMSGAFWGEVFTSNAKRADAQTDYGYRVRADGFVFGRDKKIDNNSIIGASLSYSNSRVSFFNSLRRVDIDSYQLNVYGGKFYNNNVFWDAVAGIVRNEYNSYRSIPSISQKATAKYSGINYVARLRFGKVYKNIMDSKLVFTPEISTTIARINVDSYSEKGAGTVGLNVKKTLDNYLEGRIGYNLSYQDSYKKENDLRYRFHNSYGYNFLNKAQKTTARFIDQKTTFSTISDKDDSLAIRIGIGSDYQKSNSTIFSLDYVLDFMQNYVSHSGIARFTHRF